MTGLLKGYDNLKDEDKSTIIKTIGFWLLRQSTRNAERDAGFEWRRICNPSQRVINPSQRKAAALHMQRNGFFGEGLQILRNPSQQNGNKPGKNLSNND